MKCESCQAEFKENFPDVVFNDWLKVIHYLEIEHSQGDITEATYLALTNALLSVKPITG